MNKINAKEPIPAINLVFRTSLQSYYDAITVLVYRDNTLRANGYTGLGPYVYIGDVYKQLNREFQKELIKPLPNGFQITKSNYDYFSERGVMLELIETSLLSIKYKNSEIRIFLSKE